MVYRIIYRVYRTYGAIYGLGFMCSFFRTVYREQLGFLGLGALGVKIHGGVWGVPV